MRAVPIEEKIRFMRFLDTIDKRFNIDTLEERIEIQKLVYLAQTYGFDFNYRFSWYFHGPYCSSLSDVVYRVDNADPEICKKVRKMPANKICPDPQKLQQFQNLVAPYLDDVSWLEAAGSLVWVRERHYKGIPLEKCRDSLIKDISFVYKKFDPSLVMEVLERLEEFRAIK